MLPKQMNEDISLLKQYLALNPRDKTALTLLATFYLLQEIYEKVLPLTDRLLALNPADEEALYIAARTQAALGHEATAFALMKKVTELKPDHLAACMALVAYYEKTALLEERIALLEKIICYKGQDENAMVSEAWNELGGDQVLLGHIPEAKQAFLQACQLKIDPADMPAAYSSYLMSTNYDLTLSAAAMLREHAKYNAFFRETPQFKHKAPRAKKKLRLGYVSADFYHHVMAYFLYHLVLNYNRSAFEVYCYRTSPVVDDATTQLQSKDTVWRDLSGLAPAAAARRIHRDKIDILIELGGHTAGNALSILAYKPAPLQLCGLGYINTTGLDAVDYFITDAHIDPPGQNDAYFSEQLLRLPHTQWCYVKRLGLPDCKAAPCQKNGYVTFCSFNNFSKITDAMLRLWQMILQQLPTAKLILKNKLFKTSYGKKVAARRLENLGVDLTRLEFRATSATHMQEYQEMDIALDTHPYQGGATTCEALYMGVPVITLAGERHSARFGYSMLKNIGLEECIAQTEAEYIAKAVALASNTHRLNELHGGLLRQKMEASPLMDEKIYMQDLETAYQEIWQKHIAGSLKNTAE